MSKGILEILKEAPTVTYDSERGITMAELKEGMEKLANYKPRKPEYVLNKWEAQNLPLWQLQWLGENYIVLTSFENAEIVRERESKYDTNPH